MEKLLMKQRQEFESRLSEQINELKIMQQKNAEQEQEINKLNKEIETLQIRCQYHVPKIEILDDETVENLEKLDKLGEGEGGKVYKVFKQIPYVLKVMKVNNENQENLTNFLNENDLLNAMNHPNILKTFGLLMNSKKKLPSVLLEYCPTNLDIDVSKNALNKVKILFSIYQIAEGMKYAHFLKVFHRNLKPTNILIAEDGTIKICDFGISKLMTAEVQSLTRGVISQKFMAPELFKEESDYDEKVDVYSFGVLICFILNGGDLSMFNVDDIIQGKMPKLPPSFTVFAKHLVNLCCNPNPNERPNFKSILEKLERNNYKLIDVSNAEFKTLQARIENHKAKLPIYDE